MDIICTVTSHIPVTREDVRVGHIEQFWIYVAVRPSYLYNSLEEKLNHDYCQTCSFKSRSAAAKAMNVQVPGALSKDTQGGGRTNASSDVVSTTQLFVRFNQQPTSWSSSGGDLPTFGALCQAPQ